MKKIFQGSLLVFREKLQEFRHYHGVQKVLNIKGVQCTPQSLKFKRVSLNETPKFPFWGLNTCVDFDLRESEKWRV